MNLWKSFLLAGLKEDGWPWDWTTLGIQRIGKELQAKVIAKSKGVWAAEGLVQTLNQIGPEMNGGIQAQSLIPDGTLIKPQDVLVELRGDSKDLLALERPVLNLAAYVSGIATTTRRLVELIKRACPKNPPRLSLTRKTLPYYRDLSIHAVRVGGGFPHRVSLSGGILVKENHIAAAGGIQSALVSARATAPHGLKIEVEVRNEGELQQALEARADGILLDNFSPDGVRSALGLLDRYTNKNTARPFIEVSGGLNEENLAGYALEGVDVLSIGSLTHSVKAVDLSMLVDV